jgi:hypothetical protein
MAENMAIVFKEDYQTLKEVFDKYNRLIEAALLEDASGEEWEVWSPVFDHIFSERCSRIVYKLLPNFHPYIPDTTYGADVMGFWREFEDSMNNIKVV